jgi:CheY-like chemotaxis protein
MTRSERAWRRVLVVDDDRDTREMYCESLRGQGFDASTAASAEDALAAIPHSVPAVVVTDLRFRGKMDGVELARRLRSDERTKDVRIIMLTGAAFGEERERAEASGCDRFLVKPCLPATLATEIRLLTVASLAPGTHGKNLRANAVPAHRHDRRKV